MIDSLPTAGDPPAVNDGHCGQQLPLRRNRARRLSTLALGLLVSNSVAAQDLGVQILESSTEAAALTSTDGLLAVLPGVLIGGLALIFAVRERARCKRLRATLEANVAERRSLAQTEALRQLAAEHSAVGLWEIGADGETLYANAAMCQLLNADSPAALAGVKDSHLLQPTDGGDSLHHEQTTPYRAILSSVSAGTLPVLVFEQRLTRSAIDEPVILRTVINIAELPQRSDKHPDSQTIAA